MGNCCTDKAKNKEQGMETKPVLAVAVGKRNQSGYIANDLLRYRQGYPDLKEDDENKRDNLDFYMNKLESRPRGAKIDEIHAGWKDNYELLERHHGYIQWLFPLREPGMNYQASPLQLHEMKAITKDKCAKDRVLKSFKMMLGFYGMALIEGGPDGEVPRIERTEDYIDRYKNLNRSSHNYLRITRILKSLGELGWEHLKPIFVEFVLDEIFIKKELENTRDSCVNYWVGTIRDDSKREELSKKFCAKHKMN